MRKQSIAVVVLLCLFATSGFAKNRKYSWEFSPYVGGRFFDSDMDSTRLQADPIKLNDMTVVGARIGWNWSRHWETELNLSFAADGSGDVEYTTPTPRTLLGNYFDPVTRMGTADNVDLQNIDLNMTKA